jgi:hypothetical protein
MVYIDLIQVDFFRKCERRKIFERMLSGRNKGDKGSVGMTFNMNLKDILSLSGLSQSRLILFKLDLFQIGVVLQQGFHSPGGRTPERPPRPRIEPTEDKVLAINGALSSRLFLLWYTMPFMVYYNDKNDMTTENCWNYSEAEVIREQKRATACDSGAVRRSGRSKSSDLLTHFFQTPCIYISMKPRNICLHHIQGVRRVVSN